jgi:hypothetical protein
MPSPEAESDVQDSGDPENGTAVCNIQSQIVSQVCCGKDPDWNGQWLQICESIWRIEPPYALPSGPLYESETSAMLASTGYM